MNLSDLVHRSARDSNNSDNASFEHSLPTNAKSPNSTFGRSTAMSNRGNNNSNGNLFQQLNVHSVAATSPSSETNTLTNLTGQSQRQPFHFSMSDTDWLNDGVLFNNHLLNNGSSEPSLEESVGTSHTNNSNDAVSGVSLLKTVSSSNKPISSINDILTGNIVSPITTDASLKQQTPVYPPPQQESYKHSPQQQQQFQNPFFYNQKYRTNDDSVPSSSPNHSIQYSIDNSTFLPYSANNHIKDDLLSPRSFDSSRANATVPKTKKVTPNSIDNSNTYNAGKSTVSPLFSLTQPQPSATFTAAFKTSNEPTIDSSILKNSSNDQQAPTDTPRVTGENVTADNILDGYIQFVLHHDPNYISDGIESTMFVKRKFQSVPKTGDITYTTWDVFQLVKKLHHQEIKNWSQLVGQLGLQDMAGRPQFAQRVKRWMHKYKIDCYFDYLLGNEYDFNPPDDRYSKCLLIGNYKRKGAPVSGGTGAAALATSTVADHEHRLDVEDGDEDATGNISSPQEQRLPILLAGSRKRLRDHNQLVENAQKLSKTSHTEDEEPLMEMEEEGHEIDTDDDDLMSLTAGPDSVDHTSLNEEEGANEGLELADDDDEPEEETAAAAAAAVDTDNEEEEESGDEIDELASSSSSPSLPIITRLPSPKPIPKKIPRDTVKETTSITAPIVKRNPVDQYTQTEQALISPLQYLPPLSSCLNCKNTEKETHRLKAYVLQLEAQVEKQNKQISKLLRVQNRTEKWRRQIISDLARGPAFNGTSDTSSTEDSYDDEEEDDETGDTTVTTNSGEV